MRIECLIGNCYNLDDTTRVTVLCTINYTMWLIETTLADARNMKWMKHIVRSLYIWTLLQLVQPCLTCNLQKLLDMSFDPLAIVRFPRGPD